MMWSMLGADGELLEALVMLQLRFSDGRLRIAECMLAREDSAQLAIAVLTTVWQFRSWTDSRRASMGRTSRRVISALLTGVESLIAFLGMNLQISEYYIQVFVANIMPKHRRAVTVGAVASKLSDACIYAIMRDNRLPSRLPDIDKEIKAQIKWVTNIDTRLWKLFADNCESTVESLRSECITVSATSVGYMELRIRGARVLPWSLLGPG